MSQSETRTFLNDLLLRYQPDIDLSEGSRAQTELVEPILARIGTDPFDADIETFVRLRLQQAFPALALAETQALEDTLISPMRVLLEPIVREVKLVKLRQAAVANAERLSDDEIDAAMANFFESRIAGGYARGVVRVWFSAPTTVAFTMIQLASTRSGLRFRPSPAQTVTVDQMALNRDGQEYYCDITYVAEKRGDEYNIDRNEIVSISNLPAAARIRNPNRFSNGTPRENSLDFVARTESGLSDRNLTVSRGIFSELSRNFPGTKRVQVVGFKDPEMQRDVVKGGGLGAVPEADSLGDFYGDAIAIDDGDGDSSTQRLTSSSGHWVSRIGSAGASTDGYYITLIYFDPDVIMKDVAVLEVISDTDILIDYEIPGFPVLVHWGLRRRELTISDIPGGITLPDTPEGDLVINSGEVHIGGKTDVYIAGGVEEETTSIDSISDEVPLARGINATTQGATVGFEDWVIINDPPGGAAALLAALQDGTFSLVLDEGVDAGAYDVRDAQVAGLTVEVRVSVNMTGAAANLTWRIVDEINIELTEPKNIRTDGVDAVVVAGNPNVTTLGSTNFIDANVQPNDTLRITSDEDGVGGDYNIDVVSAVTLQVSPEPQRTASNLKYVIFRAGNVVQTPVVRVKSLELLDSGGAPNGVTIPYRDPVAVITRGFQNEGSGVEFEGYPGWVGLVTGALGATTAFGAGQVLTLVFSDPAKLYAGPTARTLSPLGSVSVTFTGSLTPTAIAAALNADAAFLERRALASVIDYDGLTYVGIYAAEAITVDLTGTANASLGFPITGRAATNYEIGLPTFNPRQGDLIEFLDGNNRGTNRVLRGHDTRLSVLVGLGPSDDLFDAPLHEVTPLLPEVGVRARVGRPSVGSARVYFLSPTSAEFRYLTTAFSVLVGTDTLSYRPDPENDRIIQPPPTLTALPDNGTTSSASTTTFEDLTVNFQALGIRPGDYLDVLYQPIRSTGALSSPGTIAGIVGQTLILRLDENPWITITFPVAMIRADIADYINEQVGEDLASIDGTGFLVLQSAKRITVREDSTVLSPDVILLDGAPRSSTHPRAGTYVISDVDPTTLYLSALTPFSSATAVTDTSYRVRRALQRISSTEMNLNQDDTGLYYVDVELLSLAPGDRNNAPSDLNMAVTGAVCDGFRLTTENDATSYSRAERLYVQLSRTILLPGSSDSPAEYVQLSRQNVQVSYDRSQLVDDVQSFCDSDDHRVVNEEILVRHLLPHYVNLNWRYAGGETEPKMRQALTDAIDAIETDDEFEVLDLTSVMAARGATKIYSPDPSSPTGRTSPVMVVVYHDTSRVVQAALVHDYVKTSRTQRFIADDLAIRRVSPGGLR